MADILAAEQYCHVIHQNKKGDSSAVPSQEPFDAQCFAALYLLALRLNVVSILEVTELSNVARIQCFL
jgi:hypothetical protein